MGGGGGGGIEQLVFLQFMPCVPECYILKFKFLGSDVKK